MSRAMTRGSVADVMRYNVFSQSLACRANEIFGAPLVTRLGDFPSLLPMGIAEIWRAVSTLFPPNIGVRRKMPKSEWCARATFHGLEGAPPQC